MIRSQIKVQNKIKTESKQLISNLLTTKINKLFFHFHSITINQFIDTLAQKKLKLRIKLSDNHSFILQ